MGYFMKEEFKNYKEKQQYYKQRSKNSKYVWISKEPNYKNKSTISVIKGRTYVKPKGDL